MRNAVALLFACLALVTPSAVPAQTLEDVVRDLEAAYSRMTDLRAEFNVRFLNPAQPKDGVGNWVLDLTPKQPLPTLVRLILAVDAKTWELRTAVVYDQFENTVTMRFAKVAINSSLPEGLFTFVTPKGVATVPLR